MYQPQILNVGLLRKLMADVYEFRTTFGLEVNAIRFLEGDEDVLHTLLAVEELEELANADNPVDQMDAIVDSIYVLTGRIVHILGKGEHIKSIVNDAVTTPELYLIDLLLQIATRAGYNFKASWDAVHASNMTKACDDLYEAEKTRLKYLKDGVVTTSYKVGEYYIVKCVSDENDRIKPGKVLKSINYTPVNLTEVMWG